MFRVNGINRASVADADEIAKYAVAYSALFVTGSDDSYCGWVEDFVEGLEAHVWVHSLLFGILFGFGKIKRVVVVVGLGYFFLMEAMNSSMGMAGRVFRRMVPRLPSSMETLATVLLSAASTMLTKS